MRFRQSTEAHPHKCPRVQSFKTTEKDGLSETYTGWQNNSLLRKYTEVDSTTVFPENVHSFAVSLENAHRLMNFERRASNKRLADDVKNQNYKIAAHSVEEISTKGVSLDDQERKPVSEGW